LPDAFTFDLPLWIVMHEDLRSSARYRAVFDALATDPGRAASREGETKTKPKRSNKFTVSA
jgi:hypothetical protein